MSLTPLIAQLWDVAESRYGRNLDDMAMDLGIPVESLEDLLAGKSWINARWFLRRLATLLYQDRESLVRLYNETRELGDERVSAEDIDLLRRAVAVVEQWGGTVTIPEDTIEPEDRGGAFF